MKVHLTEGIPFESTVERANMTGVGLSGVLYRRDGVILTPDAITTKVTQQIAAPLGNVAGFERSADRKLLGHLDDLREAYEEEQVDLGDFDDVADLLVEDILAARAEQFKTLELIAGSDHPTNPHTVFLDLPLFAVQPGIRATLYWLTDQDMLYLTCGEVQDHLAMLPARVQKYKQQLLVQIFVLDALSRAIHAVSDGLDTPWEWLQPVVLQHFTKNVQDETVFSDLYDQMETYLAQ